MALRVGSPGALLHPGLRVVCRQERWGSGPVSGRWKEVTPRWARVSRKGKVCVLGGSCGPQNSQGDLLGLELWETDGQQRRGGPRQTRPNCTVSEGGAEEDPSAGRLRRKGAPQRPQPRTEVQP